MAGSGLVGKEQNTTSELCAKSNFAVSAAADGRYPSVKVVFAICKGNLGGTMELLRFIP